MVPPHLIWNFCDICFFEQTERFIPVDVYLSLPMPHWAQKTKKSGEDILSEHIWQDQALWNNICFYGSDWHLLYNMLEIELEHLKYMLFFFSLPNLQ